jgi:hypothetical protein
MSAASATSLTDFVVDGLARISQLKQQKLILLIKIRQPVPHYICSYATNCILNFHSTLW